MNKSLFHSVYCLECAFLTFFLLLVCTIITAQQKDEIMKLAQELKLSHEQRARVLQIELQYQKDMYGLKEQAENGFYSPGRVQFHHTSCLVRRLKAFVEILNPEQYTRIIEEHFDVYPERAWLATFYRNHKLPSIERAVFKKLSQLLSGKNDLKERIS